MSKTQNVQFGEIKYGSIISNSAALWHLLWTAVAQIKLEADRKYNQNFPRVSQKHHHFISNCHFFFFSRFPQLFPPLKPEVVAQRTVDAVRTDKAFLYLPWTMHALVILKRWDFMCYLVFIPVFSTSRLTCWHWCFSSVFSFMPQVALEEIHKFSGTYTCMNTFKGRTWTWTVRNMRATSTVLGCDEGNMDLYTCESGAGPMIEWRQTHARVSLLQLQVIDKLLDTPWSYVYVYSMEDSLWSEAMHSSIPVVILGVYWHIFCRLFLLFFLILLFNMSLNQNKVIKSSFRIALSPFVHDENRKSEHLGGRHCFLRGFWLPWQCDNSFDLFQAWDQWLWQTMLSKHKMHSWGPCGAYSCLFSAVRKWYRGIV